MSGAVGLDGFAFGGEIFVEGVMGQGAEAGGDALGVELGSGHGGVGVRIAEEGIDGGLAEGVVAAGDDLVEVDKADVFGCGDLLGPAAIGGGVADNVAVQPKLARDKRAEDGRRSFSLRSEEHTSELQSRQYLVCRLLLEK